MVLSSLTSPWPCCWLDRDCAEVGDFPGGLFCSYLPRASQCVLKILGSSVHGWIFLMLWKLDIVRGSGTTGVGKADDVYSSVVS